MMALYKLKCVLFACVAFPSVGSELKAANQRDAKSTWFEGFLAELGASDEYNFDDGIDWGILPGPFSNPELGVGVGVAAIGLYKATDKVVTDPLSTLSVTAFISSTGAYGAGIEHRHYFASDLWRWQLNASINDAPAYYWGVGHTEAMNDENKQTHTGLSVSFSPIFSFLITEDTYAKVGWDGMWLTQQQYEHMTTKQVTSLSDQYSNGVVLGIETDSRDFEPNPKQGYLWSLEWGVFRRDLGSQQNFERLTGNLRHYYAVDSDNIIAMDVFAEQLTGDVPWYRLSRLGSDQRMRGYYEGQFRDNAQMNGQIEWRHQWSPYHGGVLWGGMGAIAPTFSQLATADWLPTVGIGYRFAFKPRVNVRFDFGIGQDQTGFYFHVNEAF